MSMQETEKRSQLELLKEAVAMAEANPEAKIHICAASDELLDEFGWTHHQIRSVEMDRWYADEEHIILGLEDIKECLDMAKDDGVPTTDEEALAVSHPAICIYTGAS